MLDDDGIAIELTFHPQIVSQWSLTFCYRAWHAQRTLFNHQEPISKE